MGQVNIQAFCYIDVHYNLGYASMILHPLIIMHYDNLHTLPMGKKIVAAMRCFLCGHASLTFKYVYPVLYGNFVNKVSHVKLAPMFPYNNRDMLCYTFKCTRSRC